MYYIGLDVHKKMISYCVKDVGGKVQQEGKVGSTRRELDCWMKTVPKPWMVAMEATIFSGWIYDHLVPHAEQIKVAHPLMLRAIAAAKLNRGVLSANMDISAANFRAGDDTAVVENDQNWQYRGQSRQAMRAWRPSRQRTQGYCA
jgi:hypothetical protein